MNNNLFCSGRSHSSIPDDRTLKVDSLFADFNLPDAPGASVLVIKNNQIVYNKSFGLADIANKIPAASSTNYRLASLTKQFTAMAAMILIEQKKLSYETKLTELFEDFPDYGNKISVFNLLTHTSGLADYEDLIPEETKIPLRDKQVLDLLKDQQSGIFIPGSKFQYSNSGYALLALIVEKVSGMSFAAFLKKNIFAPLGMDNTVAFENGISTISNRAYGYTLRNYKFIINDQSLTSSVLGDGGIYSSVEDLYKWDQALYTDILISNETLQKAFSPLVLTEDKNISYGFGWFVEYYMRMKTEWHYGSTVGFATAIERFPEKKFTVIVLMNRDSLKAHEIARKIVDIFLN